MPLMACGVTVDPHGRELTPHGTALFPVACYRDDLYLEDVPCPWHWHDELEAVVVSQGEVQVTAGGETFRIRAALSELVFQLVTHLPVEPRTPSAKAVRDEERMKGMMLFIQAHYGEELTVAQIAASISVSESECLRCFRSTIGTTPIQYLRQLRVQKAAELLADSDRKVSDIGEQCGFREMSYFTKTFRELKGCPPSRYREKKRAGG